MDTLLAPFLSISYFLSGVSWYHLLSELFALKLLSQGLVLEMLVPGELRFCFVVREFGDEVIVKSGLFRRKHTSRSVGHL